MTQGQPEPGSEPGTDAEAVTGPGTGNDPEGAVEDAVEADSAPADAEDPAPEPEWVRRRRLEEAFGSGEHHGGGKGDSWYRDEVPPHHG